MTRTLVLAGRRTGVIIPISNLDLRNVTFRSCVFKDIEFTKCTFDETTRFAGCHFLGRFFDDSCENFGLSEALDCELSPAARSGFQLASVRGISRKVTKQQVTEAAYDLLRRFARGPMGFVTRRQDSLQIAARNLALFGNDFLVTLDKNGVLERFQIGSTKMYRIGDTREARLFLSNNLATGKLLESLEEIAEKFEAQ